MEQSPIHHHLQNKKTTKQVTPIINIHKALPQPNKEVVLNVHAERTTTSEPTSPNIEEVVVANPSPSTTTSKQPFTHHLLMTLRAVGHQHPHKQTALACSTSNCSNLPTTLLQEGARPSLPSSLEISHPAEPCQHAQKPRTPTLNVTHTNIESHHETRVNSPQATNQKQQQQPRNKQKS